MSSSSRPTIPEIARGYEYIYRRFIGGKLVYKPDSNSDAGKIELPISSLLNPLEGTFDLSGCGDAGNYISIATGYRQSKLPANKNKVEIWITPKFVMEKALSTTARHYGTIMTADKWASPVGILWTYGNWSDSDGDCDYLTNKQFDEISTKNLYENWEESSVLMRWRGDPGTEAHRVCGEMDLWEPVGTFIQIYF